jgi:hypothetical protein
VIATASDVNVANETGSPRIELGTTNELGEYLISAVLMASSTYVSTLFLSSRLALMAATVTAAISQV